MKAQEKYQELFALVELYIHQEYSNEEWIECSPDSQEYYRRFAQSMKPLSRKSSIPPPPLKRPTEAELPKTEQLKPIRSVTRNANSLEPLPKDEFEDIKHVLKKVSPGGLINPQERQLRPKEKQEAEAVFLSLNDHPEHHAFLIRVAVAITNHGSSGEVITPEKIEKIGNPKLIVGTKLFFAKHPEIKERFEGKAQCIELSSIGDYIKDPSKKRELWGLLRRELGI